MGLLAAPMTPARLVERKWAYSKCWHSGTMVHCCTKAISPLPPRPKGFIGIEEAEQRKGEVVQQSEQKRKALHRVIGFRNRGGSLANGALCGH